MRATEHAPRCPIRFLERRQGLAEIVERGAVVKRPSVIHRQLADRAFSLTSGIVGNANSNLGRPPRPPGFKKRPNTAGAQPMGGLPIEEFLAVMNGGGDSGDLVGKLMQLGISLASNAG